MARRWSQPASASLRRSSRPKDCFTRYRAGSFWRPLSSTTCWAFLVLAAVSSLTHGKLRVLQLSLTAILATGFTVIVAGWGTHAIRRVTPHIERGFKASEARFIFALSLLFALAVLATWTGVASIVGAFLAGLALAESTESRERDLVQGVSELLIPFFLAGIGLHVDLDGFCETRYSRSRHSDAARGRCF